MRQPPSSDQFKRLAKLCGEDLLELLELVKDYVADARNGTWTTEARRLAIEAIDDSLYNPVRKAMPGAATEKGDGMGSML